MNAWDNIIGKRVLALRGLKRKVITLDYILFDDEKTFIRFIPQDPYDYHDCSASARHVDVIVDAGEWRHISAGSEYAEPTCIFDPF